MYSWSGKIENKEQLILNIPFYQVDAFTNKPFSGNPAAVCLLDETLEDDVMQKIAAENNLSETAFAWPESDGYRLRWFTPTMEVQLCGHATLATAFILYETKREDMLKKIRCFKDNTLFF